MKTISFAPLRFAKLLIAILFVFICNTLWARQERHIIHFDQSNGFPATYSYQLYQDHLGYIWISTENGLARFNGYEFRMFTTKDGLPDNEVFNMSEDGQGRLWFVPFANTVAYIRNGKVYHTGNDTLLRKLRFLSRPDWISSDAEDNVYISEPRQLTCILKDGTVRCLLRSGPSAPDLDAKLIRSASGKQWLYIAPYVYNPEGGNLHRLFRLEPPGKKYAEQFFCIASMINLEAAQNITRMIIRSGNPFYKDYNKIVALARDASGNMVVNRKDGSFTIDISTAAILDTLLYRVNTGGILHAADGSLWVGTHGKGVYRLVNAPIRSLRPPTDKPAVIAINGTGTTATAILENGAIANVRLENDNMIRLGLFRTIEPNETSDVNTFLGRDSLGRYILYGRTLQRYTSLGQKPEAEVNTNYCKSVYCENKDSVLISTVFYLFRFSQEQFRITDTLYKGRSTSVTRAGNTIYLGTLNGLLASNGRDSFRQVFGNEPTLNGHIVKLASGSDGAVWVASNKAELTGIKDGRIIARITRDDGLECSRISAISVSPQYIWLGTSNGIYAIRNARGYSLARHITYSSGLTGNQVNCMDVIAGTVWVGTPEGISCFHEQDTFGTAGRRQLIINSITSGGNILAADSGVTALPHKDLTIDFDLVDHAGGQKPYFRYMLNEDGKWMVLTNNQLFFPSVPYGRFTVSIQALSPNWGSVTRSTLQFYRPYPYYLRWWFAALVVLAVSGAAYSISALFVRRARKRDQEKLSVQRSLLQLEQMALQSQMNPHFIFNCISSIKQYYNSGKMEKANDFIDAFASLIRDTFEMGTEQFWPLQKELQYLERYLAIEQARFDGSFSFSIIKRTGISEMSIPVPSMLLQPVVENAVRHGVRHLSSRKGMITITVIQEESTVRWIVEDNGIGRAASKSFGHSMKTAQHVTSTVVNDRRIDILNLLFDQKITFITEDMFTGAGEPAGTKVCISYPLSVGYL